MKNENIVFTGSVPKTSKARLLRSVLALAVVALIMHVLLPLAEAYDLSSLNGHYADSFSGLNPVSPGLPQGVLRPVSGFAAIYEVGLYTFDGAGAFTAHAVFNVGNGIILNADWSLNPLFTGTYSVNADGTGTMNLMGNHRRNFVIGASGNELKYIGTDPTGGIVVGGSMVKQ